MIGNAWGLGLTKNHQYLATKTYRNIGCMKIVAFSRPFADIRAGFGKAARRTASHIEGAGATSEDGR